MKTKLILGFLAIALLVGCYPEAEEALKEKNTIVISGSGSGITILKLLQPSFEKKYPESQINFLPSTSTGDGVIGVAEGMLDVGSSARKMKETEKEKYPDLIEFTILKDAMVLAVNPNVEVRELTSEEIKKIHSGEITNWNEVGGHDADIVVLDREESESSKILLREHIFGPDLKITEKAILMHSANSMHEAIESTVNSIGQTSLGVIKVKNLKIKPIAIDGVMPSISTVSDGSYKLVRQYGVIIKSGETGSVKSFVNFLFSEDAKKILEKYDFVPVSR